MDQLVYMLVEGEVFIVHIMGILKTNIEFGHLRVLNLFFAQLADVFAFASEIVEVVQSDHVHYVVGHLLNFHLNSCYYRNLLLYILIYVVYLSVYLLIYFICLATCYKQTRNQI